MDIFFWCLILTSFCSYIFLKLLFPPNNPRTPYYHHRLPPGPFAFPIIGNFPFLRKPFSHLEPVIRSLHSEFGPVVRLHIGSRPAIFINDHSLAHQALIHNGAVFADRPPRVGTGKIASSNQHNISSASYGPTWRLLRRNLTSEILHPSRVRSYSHARRWVLQILLDQLGSQAKTGCPVRLMAHFQYAMFCLLCCMCFGDKLDQAQIKEIERVERNGISNFDQFTILNFWPALTKIILRKRWAKFLQLRKDQEDVLIPLIRTRKKMKEEGQNKEAKEGFVLSYVDTLLDIQLPGEKRVLTEDEIVTLCNEFLIAGTDTTSTALQWVMANMVKFPEIQEKLFMEIKGVVGDGVQEEVKEDDLQKMPYLKAIILEGLRLHPPAHFVVPHAVTEAVVLDKFVIPKNGSVNFMVAEMGRDPKVWQDPMAFKPERFLGRDGEVLDITGTKEIKMMPFGVGRRICPGYGLAMLHLEFFVANLVWNYEWKAVDGEEVDLTEKEELTVVMKNPLQVQLHPRQKHD